MTDHTTFDDLFDHQNEEQQRPRKKKRVWRKVLVALLIIVILGVLGIGLYVWSVGRSFDKNANQLSDEQGDENLAPDALLLARALRFLVLVVEEIVESGVVRHRHSGV